ncbi:MAG TPA: immunoglobulin domain-containing protein [Verrucomicrobiae bacterium]|nr:immunoglobulin domain-containing protein [Verrucomicrobiae bacterium]
MSAVFNSKSLPNPARNGWQTNWLHVPATLPPNAYFKIGGTWTIVPGLGWTNIGGAQYQANSSGTVSLPTPGTNGQVVTYSMVITNMFASTGSVYYAIGQLNGNIFVDAPNVVLYCTNGISLSGNSTFTLNTNADVTIYTTGNISETANGTIINGPDNPAAFSIYDVAGYTNLSLWFQGNGIQSAFIYAPSSSVSFGGGGAVTYGFIGSIFCNTLSVNGHYDFHYDESLGSESIPPWISQQPTEQIVQAGSNATFGVEAGGSPLTYQWYFQAGLSNAISGATNSTLTITNAQPANWGRYSVVVSNAGGSVASSQACLLVYSNAAAALSGALIATNGEFELTVSNAENLGGMPYTIQASTNLTDWVPVFSNASPFSYLETNAFPQRYYRAVFAP